MFLNFELIERYERANDIAQLFIDDLKPLIDIAEYSLPYNRMSNIIRHEKLKNDGEKSELKYPLN